MVKFGQTTLQDPISSQAQVDQTCSLHNREIHWTKCFSLGPMAQLVIHNVINVNQLKLYDLPQLEDETEATHLEENIPNFQLPLVEDTLLDTRTRTTHHQQTTTYLVGKKGSYPSQAKWFSQATMDREFSHLLRSQKLRQFPPKQGGIDEL